MSKEKNSNGKEILRLLQEKYELNSAKDLSTALKDMFKEALQEMMNAVAKCVLPTPGLPINNIFFFSSINLI